MKPAIVHTKPSDNRWIWTVHNGAIRWMGEPQLRLDFLTSAGVSLGYAEILAMDGYAFILYVHVEPDFRGRGIGLAIHRVLAERYGAVACEKHCSDDEMRVWEAMARRRSEWRISLASGPRLCGRPIARSGAGVHEMMMARIRQ